MFDVGAGRLPTKLLAELHLRALPGSLITLVGPKFTEAFYRFCEASPLETVIAAHSGGLKPVGVAIVSLAPRTLTLRLLLGTWMAWYMLRAWHRLPLRSLLLPGGNTRQTVGAAAIPEVIYLFVDAGSRGQNLGAQLLALAEEWLQAHNATSY